MSVQENRAKWVAALRSGEYVQGADTLYNVSKQQHCCLGVLCDVYEKTTGKVLPKTCQGYYNVDEETLEDLSEVKEWVGLNGVQGEFSTTGGVPATMLTTLNDAFDEWDFNKIADLIESEPYGLFEENVT